MTFKLPPLTNPQKRYELCLLWPTAEDCEKYAILAYKWDNELLEIDGRVMYVPTRSFFVHMVFNYTNLIKPEIRKTGWEEEPTTLTLEQFDPRDWTKPVAE